MLSKNREFIKAVMSLYGTPGLNELVGLLNLVKPELELSREGLHQLPR